jgi:hypothetical protein
MRYDAITLSRTITAAIREAVAAGRLPGVPHPPPPRVAPARRPAPADDDDPSDTVFDV